MKSHIKVVLTIISTLVLLTTFDRPVFAQTCTAGGQVGIETALGCIPFSSESILTRSLLIIVLGFAGGIAFLLLIYSGFMIITSTGDKKRLEAGKELLTAAFSGLMVVVFSVFILRLLGVNILQVIQ